MESIIELKEKIKEGLHDTNYVKDGVTEENLHISDKYVSTGESEFSRDVTHPLDEVLSERHYVLTGEQSYIHEAADQKSYHRPDERIREEATDTLMRSRTLDPSDVEVSVNGGVLTLAGHVKDSEMKREAESIVAKVYGVANVKNNLSIAPFHKPLVDNRTGLN